MTKPHRDPDTGQIRVNGKVGAFLSWFEWVGKLLLLPVVLYLAAHEVRHARVDDFVAAGPRLTPEMLEQRLELYKSDVIQYVAANYPPKELLSKVESNSKALTELQIQVAVLDERVVGMSNEVHAVRRLLED